MDVPMLVGLAAFAIGNGIVHDLELEDVLDGEEILAGHLAEGLLDRTNAVEGMLNTKLQASHVKCWPARARFRASRRRSQHI